MIQEINSVHNEDKDGNPSGGRTIACGLAIQWQNGPLGRGVTRLLPNGCFVETVILAAVDRLEFYQRSKFNCVENAKAIVSLNDALRILGGRTVRREAMGTEGTHEGVSAMPMMSMKQRKWMHANKPELAEEFEKETPQGKKLPMRVRKNKRARKHKR